MNKGIVKIFLFIFFSCVCFNALALEPEFKYSDKGNRDPFQALVTSDGRILPGAKSVSETGSIEIEGIIWDPQGKSVAIINGKLVKEQDRIMNVQLLKINKTSIILQKEGKVMEVNLKREGGKGNVDK